MSPGNVELRSPGVLFGAKRTLLHFARKSASGTQAMARLATLRFGESSEAIPLIHSRLRRLARVHMVSPCLFAKGTLLLPRRLKQTPEARTQPSVSCGIRRSRRTQVARNGGGDRTRTRPSGSMAWSARRRAVASKQHGSVSWRASRPSSASNNAFKRRSPVKPKEKASPARGRKTKKERSLTWPFAETVPCAELGMVF